jgi:hypothetical protein
VPTKFPNPTNLAQQLAQQRIAAAEQYMQSQAPTIFGQLATQSGIQDADWQKASTVIGSYGGALVHAANDIISGNATLADVQPIFGAALLVAGAAPVVGLAVAAGLSIFSALTGILSPAPCSNCSGRCVANNVCLSGTTPTGKRFNVQPSGPSDANWITWDDIPDQASLLQALIPYYNQTIACELPKLNVSDPVQAFFYTYYTALKQANEYPLNGYTAPTPWDVFTQVQTTWNAVHAGPNVALIETQMQPPVTPPGQDPCTYGSGSTGAPNDPNGRSFLGALLAGNIDGQHHSAGDGINVGSSSASNVYWPGQHVGLPSLYGGANASPGKKMAVAVGAASIVAGGSLYAYAHMHGISMAQAIKRLWPW